MKNTKERRNVMGIDGEKLAPILKKIAAVTIETLPSLVELVPIYGMPLSKILSQILKSYAEYDEKNKATVTDKIGLLKEAIEQNKITVEQVKEDVRKTIFKELQEKSPRMSAYMFGIILYPLQDNEIDYDDMENIEYFLSEIGESDDEGDMYGVKETDEYEKIRDFLSYCYGMGTSLEKGRDYYIYPEYLLFNFQADGSQSLERDENAIREFVWSLNSLLGLRFVEYSVF